MSFVDNSAPIQADLENLPFRLDCTCDHFDVQFVRFSPNEMLLLAEGCRPVGVGCPPLATMASNMKANETAASRYNNGHLQSTIHSSSGSTG